MGRVTIVAFFAGRELACDYSTEAYNVCLPTFNVVIQIAKFKLDSSVLNSHLN